MKKLYYEDVYLDVWESEITRIIERDNKYLVELSETAFYPESGGQPSDLGTIDGIKVNGVIEEDSIIYHILDLKPCKTKVECKIDFEIRFDFMQQHTGQHIFSAIFYNKYNVESSSFKIDDEFVSVILPLNNIKPEVISEVETLANEYVYKNIEVTTCTITMDELPEFQRIKLPATDEKIRVDRYNALETDKRYEFRITIHNFNKWYSYITQVIRMFDMELQKEFSFTSYLIKMLPKEPDKDIDIDGKLKLEFYKLQETFKGDILLSPTTEDKTLVTLKRIVPEVIKITDDELLESINERFNGTFTEADRVIVETIYSRVVKGNKKLKTYAQNNDAEVFEQSIFPDIFKKIAQECYMESMRAFSKLFEDKNFYNSVMEEIARESYKDLRSGR